MVVCCLTSFIVVSCADDEVVSGKQASATWSMDKYKNKSIHPGDNFYRYCLANLIDTFHVSAGYNWQNPFMVENGKELLDRFTKIAKQQPELEYLYQKYQSQWTTDNTDSAAVCHFYSKLDAIFKAKNKDELYDLLAMHVKRYELVGILFRYPDNRAKLYFYLPKMDKSKSGFRARESAEPGNSRVGRDYETEIADLPIFQHVIAKAGVSIEQCYTGYEAYFGDEYGNMGLKALNDMDDAALRRWMALRLVEEGCPYFNSGEINQMADMLKAASGDGLQSLTSELLNLLYSPDLYYRYNNSVFSYRLSKSLAENGFISSETKQRVEAICEDLRATFKERIVRSDWMSETTKQRALKKLEALVFNVAYPDKWYGGNLPALQLDKSLYENMEAEGEMVFKIYLSMIDEPRDQNAFTEFLLHGYSLMTSNAFYYPWNNSMYIFPYYILPPFFDRDDISIMYAVSTIFGHEISHGFDKNGCNYNKYGLKEYWWTVNDRMEYDKRSRLLVDCYNHLEVDGVLKPGYFVNGELTLGENLADLSGFMIAYEAYNRRLQKEGYAGIDLQIMQRRFFEAYTRIDAAVIRPDYLRYWLEDPHSTPEPRVNGVMMNVDAWYRLYGVTPEHKLYLSPDRRTHIW